MQNPRASRTPVEHLSMAIATVGPVGFLPGPTGTWGSLATLPLCWLVARAGTTWLPLAVAGAVTLISFPAAGIAERLLGGKDPKPVVIDEVAGMLITMLFVPMTVGTLGAGFLLFRLFDIAKIYPANRLERIPGGVGIVADDLASGVYANLSLQAGLWLWAGFV